MAPDHLTAQGLPDSIRWSVHLDAAPIGAPVVAGSSVVLPLTTESIAAHRLSDGEPLWIVPLPAEQSLAGDSARVYVASGDAIHALDAATGAVAWRSPAGEPLTAPPLAHAGWVIGAAAGDVLAIRASDGAVVWRKHVGPVEFRPTLDGDLLVVSVTDGRVVALDLPTGEVRWEAPLGSAPVEPFVIGGRVYVGAEDKKLFTLDASSGRILSRWLVGALPRGRAAVDDRHVYFTAMDNVLWAIDRGDGAIEWRKGLEYRPAAGPVLVGSAVVVPGDVKSLPAFNAQTGKQAGEVGFPELLSTVPLFIQGPDETPLVLGITGSLANKWMMTMMGPSPSRGLKLEPLTALPGAVVPVSLPQAR
ncbi:MAG: PQQ-binding-like beta-propeller repeat protein [Vicinamibacterales bacterium]